MESRVKLVSLLVFVVFSHCEAIRSKRLIGAPVSDAPVKYYAEIYYSRSSPKELQICGGVVLSEKAILTHGSCFNDTKVEPSACEVSLGGYKEGHNEYKNFDRISFMTTDRNSAAILWTSGSLPLGDIATPAKLSGRYIEQYEDLTVYGFGFFDNNNRGIARRIRKATMQSTSQKQCVWEGETYIEENVINDDQMCLYSEYIFCWGDVGSPVVDKDDNVVGMVSYTFDDCAKDSPNLALRSTAFYDWVRFQLI